MFNAYPEQQRVRCGKKRVLIVVFSIGALAIFLYGEQAFQKERRVKHTEMKDVHFLQPFVYSPGFEVGLWTWQKGYIPTSSTFQPTTQKRSTEPADDAKQEYQADDAKEEHVAHDKKKGAEIEVERLRAELEVERQRSALQREELHRLVQEARTQKDQSDAEVGKQRSGVHKETSDTETGKQKSLQDEARSKATALETTDTPAVEVKAADSEKVEEKVRIPSSLFRQPPSVEESTNLQKQSTQKVVPLATTPAQAPPSIVTEVVSQAVAKEAATSVVASSDGEQPTITLKAGGSEIHVKLGEAPVAPQPQVKAVTSKEEPIAATTTQRIVSEPPAADPVTTTLPTKSAAKPSLDIMSKTEALPLSSTTTATVVSESAPSAGTAVAASQGTSITLKSQGQTITIEIGSGTKEQKSEPVHPTVQQSTASLAIAPAQLTSANTGESRYVASVSKDSTILAPPSKAVAAQQAPATVSKAVSAQLPKPIGTPAPQVLNIPSAIVRQSTPEYNATEKLQVFSPQADPTTSTTSTTTVTTEDEEADRYANLAMRAR